MQAKGGRKMILFFDDYRRARHVPWWRKLLLCLAG